MTTARYSWMIDGVIYEYVSSTQHCSYKKQTLKTLIMGATGGGQPMVRLVGVSKIDGRTIDPPRDISLPRQGRCWFAQREIIDTGELDIVPMA